MPDNRILRIYKDNKGNIWLLAFENGAVRYVPSALKGQKGKFETYSKRNGLNSNIVWTIQQDNEDNYWFGVENGVCKYSEGGFETYGEKEGLLPGKVNSILEDSRGNIWIGTEKGVTKLTLNKGNAPPIVKHYTEKNGLSKNKVMKIIEDNKGFIWFATYGGGVCKFDPKKNRFQVFTTKEGLAGNFISSIAFGKNGIIWFGSFLKGISMYDPERSTFKNFTAEQGLKSSFINTMLVDRNNNLWIVEWTWGLIKFDGANFRNISKEHGITPNNLYCLTEDKKGDLWLGANNGLYKYDGIKFENYTIKDGLSGNSIFSVICDNDNNIWVSTHKGIDKFILKDTTFKNYSKLEGFSNIEITNNAVCKDRRGNLWFGANKGVIKYNSQKDKSNPKEPFTHIIKLEVFRKEAPMPQDARFPYSQNHLTFHFVGISLSFPEKVRYQYKLEGFDKEWSPATKERYAVYANLPYGKYTFKVKACNNDGVWNKNPAVYEFEIAPPFWLSWWFISIIGLAVLSLIYVFTEYRVKIYKRAKADLEKIVEIEAFGRKKLTARLNKENTFDYKIYFWDGLKILDKDGNKVVKKWKTQKIKSVFCYLIENKEKRILKNQIIKSYWQKHDTSKASTSLYNAIYIIRKAFSFYPKGNFILTANQCYYVNPNYKIYIDAEEYNMCLDLAKKFEKAGKIIEQINCYIQADTIYRKEYLEGIHDSWSRAARKSYKEKHKKVLLNLINYHFNSGNYKDCLGFCERMIELDAFEKTARLKMITCYEKIGDKRALKKHNKFLEDIFNGKNSSKSKQK
ncbi:MAG: hypothetical protein K8R79_03870 [Calditrichales bacterium]|nr:hypothetical protein [Calditrichales bacterium]